MSDSARVSAEAGRDALARLLATISAAQLAAVARDVFRFLPLSPEVDWDDGRAVVDKIASLDQPNAGVPPLVAYAIRLSYEVGQSASIGLGRWADATGREAGLADSHLRRLFAEAAPARRTPEPAPTTATGRYGDQGGHFAPGPQGGDAEVSAQGTLSIHAPTPVGPSEHGRIWGNVPPRNADFTGRENLLLDLQRSLEAKSRASVLPHALHGSGGVGKSQLAVEFAYRFNERYDLIYWIPAEQQSLVLQSLVEIGRVLGVPHTQEFTQAATLVLDALATTELRWLLIFDNAGDPDELSHLIPTSGGHVLLTSRNEAWLDVWDAIKVDVFARPESIELAQRRGTGISVAEADQLADRLRDLPLAIDQAAAWQSATGTPIADYLALLDRHYEEVAAQNRAITYPASIATLVRLSLEHLQRDLPAVAQLFELFAVFGAEPISVNLLHRGRSGDLGQPLGRALRDSVQRGRIVRDLRKFGLAKVDVEGRIQVHRLFQVALRDVLEDDRLAQSRTNVHRLLGSANPGDPDDRDNRRTHAEIAPHVLPSDLIGADERDPLQTVLDQIRYLWNIGDNEGSRRLGEVAVGSWKERADQSDLGPDGELTLIASRHLSTTLLSLGVIGPARTLIESALEGSTRSFGADHEHTLWAAAVYARQLRIDGQFRKALQTDEDTVARYRTVFGAEDANTLRNRGNLAVDLRMLSDFRQAFEIDQEIVHQLDETLTDQDLALLYAQLNLVRDLYGLGDFREALNLQERILPLLQRAVGNTMHPNVLVATRSLATALRKTGRYAEALKVARENYRDSVAVFREAHEHALSATMTYANTLRANDVLEEARGLATEAVAKYQRTFGRSHPLTLVAMINTAVVERARGNLTEARRLDTTAHETMTGLLGADHGFTLCAASGLANDHALAGDSAAARRISAETLAASLRSRGPQHPYTLLCAANAAFDEMAVGDAGQGEENLTTAIAGLADLLGPEHPEVLDLRRGTRAECDIEPPPT